MNAIEQAIEALRLSKNMHIANDCSLPRTFEVIDEAISALQSMQGEAVAYGTADHSVGYKVTTLPHVAAAWRDMGMDVDALYKSVKSVSPNRADLIETIKAARGTQAHALADAILAMCAQPQSPAVVEGLDFDLIAAVLEDYCFLQTSGIVSAANRYSTSVVNEQIDLLTASGKGGM